MGSSSGFDHLCHETFPLDFSEYSDLCSMEDPKDIHVVTLGFKSEQDALEGEGKRVRQG